MLKRFDHKGDWAVEPSEVIISVSENVAESSRAKIHIRRRFWRNLLGHPRDGGVPLVVDIPVVVQQGSFILSEQESVGREYSTPLAVVCPTWRHFLSR